MIIRVLKGFLVIIVLISLPVAYVILAPRPTDTTDPAVFSGDGAEVDYCELPVLDGKGKTARDIPKAHTPDCGWQVWPMPILAECTEPLAPDAVDMRGLWKSTVPGDSHVERVEQCGDRMIVTAPHISHDFYADGTVANGVRDVSGGGCTNIWVAMNWQDGVLNFRPFGTPYVIVTRRMEGDRLMWRHPRMEREAALERICRVPNPS